MSDPNLTIQRQILDVQSGHERLRKADVPALYLPWTQRILNPFPLASSASIWGEQGQPWSVNLLTWYVSVFVSSPNSATQFWTLVLVDSAGATLATITTASISPDTHTRLSTTSFTQPGASNARLGIRATATLSPGAITILPALALLRTGN